MANGIFQSFVDFLAGISELEGESRQERVELPEQDNLETYPQQKSAEKPTQKIYSGMQMSDNLICNTEKYAPKLYNFLRK